MKITVTEDFISHRTDKALIYNRRKRDQDKFLMDIDAEIVEWFYMTTNQWQPHKSWMVDGINHLGRKVDVKFISKWYNISNQKMLNIVKQRNILDDYSFWEWIERPARPMRAGDEVTVRHVCDVKYGALADNIRVSTGRWGGFYADPRGLLRRGGTAVSAGSDDNRGLYYNMGSGYLREFSDEERDRSKQRERINA